MPVRESDEDNFNRGDAHLRESILIADRLSDRRAMFRGECNGRLARSVALSNVPTRILQEILQLDYAAAKLYNCAFCGSTSEVLRKYAACRRVRYCDDGWCAPVQCCQYSLRGFSLTHSTDICVSGKYNFHPIERLSYRLRASYMCSLQILTPILRGVKPELGRQGGFAALERLEMRPTGKEPALQSPNTFPGVCRVFLRDVDWLDSASFPRGVGHELHLARLLQGDIEVHGRFDAVRRDEEAVVLQDRRLAVLERCRDGFALLLVKHHAAEVVVDNVVLCSPLELSLDVVSSHAL